MPVDPPRLSAPTTLADVGEPRKIANEGTFGFSHQAGVKGIVRLCAELDGPRPVAAAAGLEKHLQG